MINENMIEDYDNIMTRYLTGLGPELLPLGHVGEDEVDLALANIRRHFDFVGLQSRSADDARMLQDHFGLPPDPLRIDNTSPEVSPSEALEFAAVDWAMVDARNHADVLLYRRLEEEKLVSRVLG